MLSVYVEHLITELLREHGGKLVSVMEPDIRRIIQSAVDQERERDAGQLERRASEIEAGQDAASVSAWLARILRDEARTIRA